MAPLLYFLTSKFSTFPKIVLHENLLLTITSTTKKELAKSVQPFTRDEMTKGNRDPFLYIEIILIFSLLYFIYQKMRFIIKIILLIGNLILVCFVLLCHLFKKRFVKVVMYFFSCCSTAATTWELNCFHHLR